MAADTRPYKSKEQDGQGNEVIIRDQQLVEQSTVTTMPSGACFETLDIDGRPVKIPRDNMMSIVLECIGIVLNDSSKNLGTNVNKALGLQGNTIGNVTVNDFASVLGASFKKLGIVTTSSQLDAITEKSVCEVSGDHPISGVDPNTMIITMPFAGSRWNTWLQMEISPADLIRVRTKWGSQNWGSWDKIYPNT